jgi:hypothetical protein
MNRINIDIKEFMSWRFLSNLIFMLDIDILVVLENEKYGFTELPLPL